MEETVEKRLTDFAYMLLDANVTPFEVYQESLSFLTALVRENVSVSDWSSLVQISPQMMESAAKALQSAQNRLDEVRFPSFNRGGKEHE